MFSGRRHVRLLRASPHVLDHQRKSQRRPRPLRDSRRLRTREGHSQHPVPAARREKTHVRPTTDRPSDLSLSPQVGQAVSSSRGHCRQCSNRSYLRQGASQRPIRRGVAPLASCNCHIQPHPQNQSSVESKFNHQPLSTQLDQPPIASLLLATETKRVL